MLDPVSIAAIATLYLVKGAEALAKTAGEKIGGIVGDLAQAVANKFKGDSYAEQTLARAQEEPDSMARLGALQAVLAEKMKNDPNFVETILRLVDALQKESAGTIFDQRGQTVHGNQTNIREANAPVFSGTFSGPVAVTGDAMDLCGSTGAIIKPTGQVEQHYGDRISIKGDGNVIGDASQSTVIKKPATKDIEPPDLSNNKEAERDIERLNLRMDVAVPDNVQVDRVFDVAVSIRSRSSPILSINGLAHVESGPVLARRHKSQSPIRLQVQISAPDCQIHDSDRQSVLYFVGEDSDAIYFQLTPKKQGEISIVVRLYQEEERLGNARVHTHASNEVIGKVEVTTSSMPVRRASRVDFLLVAPLPEERDAILKKLKRERKKYKQLPPAEDDIHTYYQSDVAARFSDGETGIYHVTVLPLIGMGQVQAATATTKAIDRWEPRYVIVIGIAGGIAEKGVQIGDILIADQVANYEIQKITPEGPEIRWDVHQVDQRLLNACKNFIDESWSELVEVDRPEKGEPKRFYGPIVSGDKVVAFGDFLEKHHETWPKLTGVEMEAAGAAKAAFQSSTNPGFFMVRCVSDLADENQTARGHPTLKGWGMLRAARTPG